MPSRLPEPPSPNPPGCWKCQKKKCVICLEHLFPTTRFVDHRTGSSFTIRDHITCDTESLVYLIFCAKCPTARYIGQTKNTLRTRFYLHRSHISKNTGTPLTLHFNQPDHSLQDMKCHGIEVVHRPTMSARLKRETFWMNKLHSVHPEGLNTLV